MSKLGSAVTRLAGRAVAFARWIVKPEKLGACPPEEPRAGGAPRPSFLRWLLARETLPREPGGEARQEASFVGWLLRREVLPRDGIGEGGPRGAGRSFLRDLFSSDRLDDPAGGASVRNAD